MVEAAGSQRIYIVAKLYLCIDPIDITTEVGDRRKLATASEALQYIVTAFDG